MQKLLLVACILSCKNLEKMAGPYYLSHVSQFFIVLVIIFFFFFNTKYEKIVATPCHI